MAVPVIMPRQGQSVETCIITRWIKRKGEAVKTGDLLFSYETDKAAFDVEAQADGILLDTFYGEGDEVPVLTNVAAIGNNGETVEDLRPGSEIAPAVVPAAAEQVSTGEKSSTDRVPVKDQPEDMRFRISPRARIMAVRMGVDPASLAGSGPNGRVIVRDIEAAATAPSPGSGVAAEYTDTKLSNIRKLIARAMHESISQSAQLTHHMSADVRKLLELRNKVKADMEKGNPLNITLNDMICYAVIRALEKFPLLNSHFQGDSLRTFRKVNLGLAVDTPRGLMVPAVQHAGELSLKGLSVRLREIADQCKKGNINPELLASNAASFTVSNLGNYGVEMFTPIINLPQVAILGVNTITYRPADLGNGIFGFVPVIGLSLTYDHRAVDGGPATLFLREIKNQIENFEAKI
jgi:pyruvate dehydrogenase E2 component (dihydrolipoamide acetyltransferase)